jgi:hypothetical protein
VGNGLASGQFLLGALLVDVNPLLVAGCLREQIDTILGYLDPVADADLRAEG